VVAKGTGQMRIMNTGADDPRLSLYAFIIHVLISLNTLLAMCMTIVQNETLMNSMVSGGQQREGIEEIGTHDKVHSLHANINVRAV